MADLAETVEIATLDKEMAEEKVSQLNKHFSSICDSLIVKYQQTYLGLSKKR